MQSKAYPTYAQSFGIIGITLLLGLLSALILMPFVSIESTIGMSLGYLLSFSATVGVTLYLRRDYTFKRNAFRPVVIGLSALTILCLNMALDPITSLVPVSESLYSMFKDVHQHPLILFSFIVIVAPILEELLFRGIMLDGLLKNYNAVQAILFNSLLFGVIHGNFVQGVGAFCIGMVIGWVYWKTQSIIACILIHMINNLVAFSSILITPQEDLLKTTIDQIGNPIVYWLLVAVSMVVVVIGVWLLHNKILKQPVIQDAL